jgi:hypothetical protein
MSIEANKALVRRYLEDAPSNPAACDEIFAPVVRLHAIHWRRCGPRGAAAGEPRAVVWVPSTQHCGTIAQ